MLGLFNFVGTESINSYFLVSVRNVGITVCPFVIYFIFHNFPRSIGEYLFKI